MEVVELEDNQVFGGASLKWVVIPGQRQRSTIGRHISLNLHTLTPAPLLPILIQLHFNPLCWQNCYDRLTGKTFLIIQIGSLGPMELKFKSPHI